MGKEMKTNSNNGDKVIFEECKSDQDEVHFIISKISEIYLKQSQKPLNLDHIAILYRTSAQTRVIEEKLNDSNLRYTIAGGATFYERKEIMELTIFLKMLNNESDDQSIINLMKSSLDLFKGIGDGMIGKIVEYAHC